MTDNSTHTAEREAFQAEFDALPLEEKFSRLFSLEASTLNQAVTFVADESLKALSKLGDAVSDLGSKVREEVRSDVCDNDKKAAEPTPADDVQAETAQSSES